jgi:hypothetical protein
MHEEERDEAHFQDGDAGIDQGIADPERDIRARGGQTEENEKSDPDGYECLDCRNGAHL